MPTRSEVYAAIDSEFAYADRRWKAACAEARIKHRPDNEKLVEEWLMFILGYFQDAADAAAHKAGSAPALDVVRKLAGLCMSCMMANGAAKRVGPFLNGPLSTEIVRLVIDEERDYQDALPPSRTNGRRKTVPGYLCMFHTYLNRAIDAWSLTAGDTEALNNIRKLAAICVRCMEEHGAPLRE